jgi:hypothetical protein
MADNLESYFKKHLSADDPVEDNWNVPSDDVWDKVAPQIHKKRGIFIPWRYIYIIGALMLALFLTFWFFTDRESATEISEIPVEQNGTSSNDSDQGRGSADGDDNPLIIEQDNETDVPPKVNESPEASNAEAAGKSGTPGDDGAKRSQRTENVSAREMALVENPEANREEETGISRLAKQSHEVPSIGETPILPDVSLPENTEALTSQHKEPLDNKGKFGLGVFLAPTWTSTSIRGDMEDGKLETSDMFLYSTNWGFELRYFISNKFTLVTGIEKSEIRSWSKSVMDFDYDTSTEYHMITGEKENTSPVPMPTPFGKINTELTYRFPGEEVIPDGEPMRTTFETHQDIRYLSIPLGVEYNIIRVMRFGWFVEGGLRFNRALRDATSFSSRVLHEGHDMDVVGEEMTNHPTFTENYLNYYLGTGLSYQFSKKLQVNGSVRYFGNITEVNLQDNVSTYVHGFNLKIGIVYIF